MSPDALIGIGWLLLVIMSLLPVVALYQAHRHFGHRSRNEKIIAAKEFAKSICSRRQIVLDVEDGKTCVTLTVRSVSDKMDEVTIYFLSGHPDFAKLSKLDRFQLVQFEYMELSYAGARLLRVDSYLKVADQISEIYSEA